MIRKIFTISLLICLGLSIQAQTSSDILYTVRAGASIGGAMPFGMPATIRGLEKYSLVANPLVEFDATKQLNSKWGVMVGLRVDRKAMDITARVKNYHITIVRGGESLSGMFSGYNQTSESQWAFSVPINATFSIDKVSLFTGPYLSYVFSHKFEGSAFDGYLRVNDPTGPKVELGTVPSDRGTYDFSDQMRNVQFGMQLGADWHFSNRWGAFGIVQCGLTGIHKGSFHTIEQTLHPLFVTIGISYKIN